jgi:bacterioferritin-associated ferredoxin
VVDRCVCEDVTFRELLALVRERGWGLPEAARRTGCGARCGRCVPYLRRAFLTGETVFHALADEGNAIL